MVTHVQVQGRSVFYYETIEGEHICSANIEQSILWNTRDYTWEIIPTN